MGCPGHGCNQKGFSVEGKSVDIWNFKSLDGNAMNSYQSDILEQLHYPLCPSCPDTKVGNTDLQKFLGSNSEKKKHISHLAWDTALSRNLFSPPYYFQDGTV